MDDNRQSWMAESTIADWICKILTIIIRLCADWRTISNYFIIFTRVNNWIRYTCCVGEEEEDWWVTFFWHNSDCIIYYSNCYANQRKEIKCHETWRFNAEESLIYLLMITLMMILDRSPKTQSRYLFLPDPRWRMIVSNLRSPEATETLCISLLSHIKSGITSLTLQKKSEKLVWLTNLKPIRSLF